MKQQQQQKQQKCVAANDGSVSVEQEAALMELYEYVVDSLLPPAVADDDEIRAYFEQDVATSVEQILTVGHVVDLLREEGICFWNDARFDASQQVALTLWRNVNDAAPSSESSYIPAATIDEQTMADIATIPLDFCSFCKLVSPLAHLFLKAFSEELVVPDWSALVADMTYHYYKVQDNVGGQNAQYIPILKDANPNKWALSICSVDGQRFSIGDYRDTFSIQSVSKPITYGLCLSLEGEEEVERWIGVEPAGRPFDTQDLHVDTQRPFNASVNSGAIMAAGLYASCFSQSTWKDCVDRIRDTWRRLSGEQFDIGFSDETFESEKATAYNNFAISYNLKGRRGLPKDVSLHKMLDVYLGCCSIEMTVEALAVAASTLANGGVCPITGKEVFPASVVRHVLAETMTCGMYDGAGKFCVDVGLPAKSGVAGALMVIVPNVFGIATFSPRLNKEGNSVRGLEFCKGLVSSYSVHVFEPLRSGNAGAKVDPRVNGTKGEKIEISRFVWAYQAGDVWATRLHDIFLYSMVKAASVSTEGLSDSMKDAIRANYKLVYHAPLNDESLDATIRLVELDSGTLKTLEELKGDRPIPDTFRALILTTLAPIMLFDNELNKEEEAFAVDLLSLCGMDRSVALMEVDRYTQRIGHAFKNVEPCDVDTETLAGMEIYNTREDFEEDHSSQTAMGQDECTNEVIQLRREVHRLRRKVTDLTRLLHQSRQDRASRVASRKSFVSRLSLVRNSEGQQDH